MRLKAAIVMIRAKNVPPIVPSLIKASVRPIAMAFSFSALMLKKAPRASPLSGSSNFGNMFLASLKTLIFSFMVVYRPIRSLMNPRSFSTPIFSWSAFGKSMINS